MSSFNDLKKQLKNNLSLELGQKLKETKIIKSFPKKEINGYSIDECIEKAEKLFQLSNEKLTYNIIEEGYKGFLGFGKKLYTLSFTIKQEDKLFFEEKKSTILKKEDETKTLKSKKIKEEVIDGTVKFIMKLDGALLKISPAKGGGKKINFRNVNNLLNTKGFTKYNRLQIDKIIKEEKNEWTKIGDYIASPDLDSKIKITVNNNMMKAYLNISAPLLTGRTLEIVEILDALKNMDITYGIKEDKIKEIIEKEIYNQTILISEGKPVENGKSAIIKFNFNTKTDSIRFKEDDLGKVNFFSDLGLMQNIVAKEVLAIKIPPTEGIDGQSITGEIIPATEGNDIPLQIGKNVTLSENGLEAIAECEGRVSYKNNYIEVESVYQIKGNVGLETGSIVFAGDLMIDGSIEDGFSVKTLGNIYVGGTIGKAEVIAEGDIIVKGGILGKDENLVKADGNITAKFIQNSKIIAKKNVIANEGILHSQVDGKCIYALGKRGMITGGYIRSLEEVNAKTLGSTSYTETKIETGVDPSIKETLIQLEEEQESINSNIKDLDDNLNIIETQKRHGISKLNPEKSLMLERIMIAKKEAIMQLEDINENMQNLKLQATRFALDGKISAYEKAYPGCEIIIKNSILKIKTNYTHSTFTLNGKEIKTSTYINPKNINKENNNK